MCTWLCRCVCKFAQVGLRFRGFVCMYVCVCMYVRTNVLVLTLLGTKKNNPNAKLGNNHQTGVSAQGSKQG